MSEVLSVKVPKETKRRMKQVPMKWSEIIRRAIEEKLQEYERSKAVENFMDTIKEAPKVPKGTAVSTIRKMREES
ncbi:MAG TPA: hypothetical protein VIH03_02955 [Nitrososphaerales archaeon]